METWKILRAKLRLVKNNLLHTERQSKFKIAVITLVVSLFLVGGYFLFYDGFKFLKGIPFFGLFLMDRLLYFLFMVSFFMLIFSNIVNSYPTLYKSEELGFLLSSPLSYRSIFFARFIECSFFSSWAFILLGIPIFLSYGIVRKVPLQFYGGIILYMFPFLLLSSSLGILIVLLLMRVLAARKWRMWLVGGGILFIPFAYYLYKILRLEKFSTQELYPFLTQFLGNLRLSQSRVLPSYWVMKALLGIVKSRTNDILLYTALLLGSALFFLFLLRFLAPRFYYPGWVNAQTSKIARVYPPGYGILGKMDRLFPFLSPSTRALVVKDIKTFCRDPRQWSQFLIFFGILAVYISGLHQKTFFPLTPYWRLMVSFLNLSAMGLILATLTTRFMFPLLSLEGRRFWIVGLAPIKTTKILWEKFWLTVVFSLLITEGLMILSNLVLDISRIMALLGIVTVFMMSFALSAMAIGMGAIFLDFSSDNPAQIVSGFGGTLNFVLSMAYVCMVVASIALPLYLHFIQQAISYSEFQKGVVISLSFTTFLSLLATIIPLRLGFRSLRRAEF